MRALFLDEAGSELCWKDVGAFPPPSVYVARRAEMLASFAEEPAQKFYPPPPPVRYELLALEELPLGMSFAVYRRA